MKMIRNSFLGENFFLGKRYWAKVENKCLNVTYTGGFNNICSFK